MHCSPSEISTWCALAAVGQLDSQWVGLRAWLLLAFRSHRWPPLTVSQDCVHASGALGVLYKGTSLTPTPGCCLVDPLGHPLQNAEGYDLRRTWAFSFLPVCTLSNKSRAVWCNPGSESARRPLWDRHPVPAAHQSARLWALQRRGDTAILRPVCGPRQ